MNGRIKRERVNQSVAVIGRLKVGELVERDGKSYPKSLDYFRADGSYSAMFHKEYGEKPAKVEIVFLSDNIQEVCNERYELRTTKEFDGVGGRLFASGDGENFRVYTKDQDEYTDVSKEQDPDIMAKLEKKLGTEWRVTLTLRFLIPRIKGVFGAWSFSTKADASTIPQIVGTLDKLIEYPGTFAGIPMDLVVEKVHSQKPGSKNSFPVVKLIPNVSQESMENLKLMIDSNMKFHGVLTDEKIEGYVTSHKQVEYTEPEKEQATMTQKVENAFMEIKGIPDGDIIEGTRIIMESKTMESLNENSKYLSKNMKWQKYEKDALAKAYNDRKGQLL